MNFHTLYCGQLLLTQGEVLRYISYREVQKPFGFEIKSLWTLGSVRNFLVHMFLDSLYTRNSSPQKNWGGFIPPYNYNFLDYILAGNCWTFVRSSLSLMGPFWSHNVA